MAGVSAVRTDKFIDEIIKKIENDNRTSIERGQKKQPKKEFLHSITPVITLLLDRLFSVTEQLYLINTVDRKISVSETTYMSFLKGHLKEEYDRYRKNKIFISHTSEIRHRIQLNPNLTGRQFEELSFPRKHSLTIDDYRHFIENYYLKENEEFFSHRPVVRHKKTKRELNFSSREKHKVSTTPAETINDVELGEQLPKAAPAPSKTTKLKSGSSGERGKNFDEHEVLKIRPLTKQSGEHVPVTFGVVEDRSAFPAEVSNGAFLYADFDSKQQKFREPFIYFPDRDLIQYADPKSYSLADGLLYVCGTAYTEESDGYLLYRYYRGSIYYIENLKIPNGGITIRRTLNSWLADNSDDDFYRFAKDFLAAKAEQHRHD